LNINLKTGPGRRWEREKYLSKRTQT